MWDRGLCALPAMDSISQLSLTASIALYPSISLSCAVSLSLSLPLSQSSLFLSLSVCPGISGSHTQRSAFLLQASSRLKQMEKDHAQKLAKSIQVNSSPSLNLALAFALTSTITSTLPPSIPLSLPPSLPLPSSPSVPLSPSIPSLFLQLFSSPPDCLKAQVLNTGLPAHAY